MELAGFLGRPHQTKKLLKILSWNVNGVKTKIEKNNVISFLLQFDIVSLNEVKTPLHICLPGYIAFKSYNERNAHRGGTVVMVKESLSREVINVDTSIEDQVWMQLRCAPGIIFGFCYIPPSDSSYFSFSSFSAIQEKVADSATSDMFCIIGDVNARFGRSVRDLLLSDEIPNGTLYKYPQIPDDVVIPNDNAHVLSSLCSGNGLLVVNNLQANARCFPSKKTFKKANQWISELDVVIASYQLIENIESLDVHQTDCLPSDHAPLSLHMTIPNVDLDSLVTRARWLGGHAALEGQRERVVLANKPISYADIDMESFSHKMSYSALPDADADVEAYVHNLSGTLNASARSCTRNRGIENYVEAGNVSDRWETILQDKDDSRVWMAINWKGMLQDIGRDNTSPSDQEFKEFYEGGLCSYDSMYQPFDLSTDVSIPILDDLR